MKIVIQRVLNSKVEIEGNVKGEIGKGLNLLVGIGPEDTMSDLEKAANKLVNLRIFEDENGKMNLSLLDVSGDLLVISQFTLYADIRKGRRPSFTNAASPDYANEMYEKFVEILKGMTNGKVETGSFGADMKVSILNDGPVTIILDSKELA